MRIVTAACLLALSFIIFLSCQKEISPVTPVITMSAGSLKADSGNCLPSRVSGIFRQGAAVSATHYIDVDVSITAAGAYTIATDTLNGISFKATGSFSAAGIQTVRLLAAGTPAAAGTFVYRIKYGNSSCTIPVVMNSTTTPAAVYTFAAGPGGDCMGAVLSGTYKAGTALTAANSVSLTVNATTAGTYSLTTAAVNGIVFSGSGVLAAGNNTIVLSATGTPVAAGITSIAPVSGGSSCNITITVAGTSATTAATYTLGGAGSSCTGVVLGGNYQAGMAMVAANTAKINVTVTVVGTYAITTAAANGVTFAASGSFTSTGAQQVTLVATGTPAAAGTFTFAVAAGNTTCSFPVTFLAAAAPAIFTLSNVSGICQTPVINGGYVATVPMTATNTVIIKVDVTTAGAYAISTNTVNGIRFSGAGVFATTGAGINVTLTATGTPLAAGTHTFTPLAGSSSCTFDVITTAAPTGIYTCKINGVFTTFYDRAEAKTIDALGDKYLYLNGYVAPANGNSITQLQIFITRNNNTPVTPGTYNVDGILLPNGYRLEIDYHEVDANSNVVIWNTSSTLFPPPNPPFTVIVSSVTATRAKGTFSGQITNLLQGSNTIKTVTEGVFDLPIQ